MRMFGLGEFLLACFLIYCAITRVVPQLLRWIIKRRYRIDARIGRIGIMTLRDVHLCAKGFTIEIDQIGFRSSFLSSEVRKLVSVVIHNIRIDKDDRNSRGNSSWRPPETVDDAKIPPIVITAAQFVSLRILKGTCALLGPSAVAHSTLTDVTVDASVVHSARSLIVSVTLDSISTQLLSPNFSKRSVTVSASLDCGATLIATTPLTVQKVDLALKNIKSVVGDDLLTSFDWIKAKETTKTPPGLKDYKAFVNAMAPVLPKKLTFSLNSCVITDAANRDMASLNKLQINAAFNPVEKQICGINGIVDVNLAVEEFNSKSLYEKFFELNNFLCSVHLDDTGIYSKVKVRDLNFLYDETKMSWFSQLLSPSAKKTKESSENGFSWPDIHIQTKLEFWNVSSTLKCRDLSPAAVGFSHIKFDYDSFSEPVRGPFCDILAESVWCQLNKVWSVSSLRKEHTWGTALYLGLLIVNANKSDLRGTVDTLRIEWSPPFSELLIPLLKYALRKGERTKIQKTDVTHKFNLNLSFNDCNFFFIANKKVCLMLRIDKSNVLSDSVLKTSFDASGLKLSSITPTSDYFACHRSTDVKSWCANVDGLRFESSSPENLAIIQLNRNINCTWKPNLHLKIREMCLHFSTFLGLVREPVDSKYVSLQKKTIQVSINGHTNLVLKPSPRHHFTLTSNDFNFSLSSTDCSWFTSTVKLSIDAADIFTIESLQFNSVHNHPILGAERKNNEDFVLPWNRGWFVSMKSAKAIFPYSHNFSSAVQDDLITVFKWLKRLHKQSAPTSPPKLPPDLLINVKEFIFEMSDDPFEVKLRDNYELLEDEYKENLKREKMLEEKINELCKSKAMVPAKMEDLYSALRVLSSDIYVKRSKMLKEQGSRTRLFAWIMSNVRVIALCDPSIHGADNVIHNMTQIDPDSPWPADGLEFSTLWCRSVAVNCEELKFLLRDFPQPWLFFKEIQLWGKVVGAEQVPTRRAKRSVTLELGDVWGDVEIERSMTSLKFYHDLNCEVERCSYAFGPCWEPVIAECNLSFEKIVRASLDPSPSLPLWDKLRLLLHGRVTMVSKQLTVLLHASRDPYNKTEEMEITWSSVAVDWTNAKVIFKGDLDIYVRTASKYDDCRLLHLPSLRLSIKLGWVCLGDPNDHHSVMPCAPDKLPDYSSNQEHDSFRAFRSQNLNISLSLETRSYNERENNTYPVALLYGSTLRWFENLKFILSGVTRPTRRGAVFKNVRPRKLPLSRHYKKVHLNLSLHAFQIHYWMSFAMQRGFELTGESIAFSSEHHLSLVPVNDGLKHRPRAEWSVVYMTCELGNAEIWLRSALFQDQPTDSVPLRLPVEKCYFLSVGKVSYGREGTGLTSVGNPIHRLVVYGLKGAWTTSNRDVVLALFESFMKTKQLKKNLSTEALKGFRDTNAPIKPQHPHPELPPALQSAAASSSMQATPSPMSKLQGSHAFSMLQQLIAEADTKAIVFSDEPITEPNDPKLQGLAACQNADDVIYKNWLIALVNSQVLLKGPETKGYVIISAAKAEILQRVHRPVWKDGTVVTKTTWVGSLQSMQYYATVSAGESDSLDENIMWLSVDNIKEKDDCVIAELPDVPQLVGSGQSVGGVVSETVGASSVSENLQLQRIVSRCKCEFFYVCYGDSTMSPSNLASLSAGVPPPLPCDDTTSLWENHQSPVDAFTLMHHDLEVCTNSLQYGMLLDIVNNLLLYVEKTRKEAYERLQRMRFQLQLQSVEDQKRPIQEAQTRVRNLVSNLRKLEKEMYLVQRTLGDEPNSPHLQQQMDSLQKQMNTCKEALNVQSDELDSMLSCYKESQLMGQKMATLRGDKTVSVVRVSEICFKHAQWRLTENDGLLGIADLVLSNFLYTKNSKSDDSVEHLLELGYVRMNNLLPNQIYTDVLQPTELNTHMPMDRKKALRVFCREKAPVGGISVKEHFEINVAPLTIGLTKKFYNKMMKFCFPERDTEEGDLSEEVDTKRSKSYSKGKDTNFYVPIERKDDVEKMKERAEKNKLFIYIKIPEVPVKVSYKGNKEKNVEDMRDFSLVIPTLEYHNVTWTWLDLLLAMKSDSRRVILSQAIKQKLQIKIRSGNEEGTTPLEEDKARMLFGSRHMPGENKNSKKGIFKFPK